MKHTHILSALALSLCLVSARADVKLPHVFGDHMVLQRGQKLPVWGWADPGEKVSVTLGSQTQTATADEKGKWRVTLDAIDSSAPLEMKVEGKNALTIS